MPRKARKTSKTKVYHIILRGNDKQDIFFDKQDYKKFLEDIEKTKEKYQYDLFCYCLMSNHVHLVIYDKNENISKAIQSLAVSYSSYFNKKYSKVGHLFQNRFLSKNVETREYLVTLCKYIHQNPVKAGISKINEYLWSSYNDYLKNYKTLVDTKTILSILGQTNEKSRKNFIKFQNEINEDITGNNEIEYELIDKLTDEQAKKRIEAVLGIENAIDIKRFSNKIRNEKIRKLQIIKGTSKAQIARVIGISKKIVERAMKGE